MARPWLQGEHVAIVGDTGSGKSYLESKLIRARGYIIVLKTKPDDDDGTKFRGFRKVRTLSGIRPTHDWYLLEPKTEPPGAERAELQAALSLGYKEEGWTLCADELYYLSLLKLDYDINKVLTQGRSKHVTFVGCAQRQQWISRFFLSQSTHCFFFRCEGRDIVDLARATSPRIAPLFEQLRRFEFVYFNRADRSVEIGTARTLNRIISNVPRKELVRA